MMFRTLFSLCVVSLAAAVTMEICQNYCSALQGTNNNYENCSPWTRFSTYKNLTCYNLCIHNCGYVYDGACMTGNKYRCCLETFPAKKQPFKISGCNYLYNTFING